MNVITPENRVSVVRADQLVQGGLYLLTDGTDTFPPQMVCVEGKPVFRDLADVGYVPVTLWADLGSMGRHCWKTILNLWDVNVPEHGVHSVHMRRIPDEVARAFGVLRGMNRQQDYGRIPKEEKWA